MKNVLVTGGSGLLGSNLVRLLRDRFRVFYTYNENYVKMKKATPIRMNFMRDYEISDKILYIRPDIIINCAAITSIGECERDRELAFCVNTYGAKVMADACKKIGSKLIQISADAVFDGKKGMYTEQDRTNPVNYYGFTKLQAERMARTWENSVIIRTNFYGFGVNGNSLVEVILEKLKNRERMRIPDDLLSTPILVDHLGLAIIELINKDSIGTYNIAGAEKISRFDLATRLAKTFGLNEGLIEPISTKHLPLKVELAADTSLDISKASKELGIKMLDINSGLMAMKNASSNKIIAGEF
jgi:dTDP-4-dehydrorhamnose reductase